MNAIEVSALTHRFGRVTALRDIELAVPDGAVYALLGPNAAGKTTLLTILLGLLRPTRGSVRVLGTDRAGLTLAQRASIGYVAEGQPLPDWMNLRQLEAFLAPLYPKWDPALAAELRTRFHLDPSRRISRLSRGDRMKVALLISLAPRPRLLIMDEPFTGIDVAVKDELVRGLLESAGDEGWTVLISSHDVGELEHLCDWVGFLDGGTLRLSEPMDALRERFRRVDVINTTGDGAPVQVPEGSLSVERLGSSVSYLMPVTTSLDDKTIHGRFRSHVTVDVRPASLREIFIGLARENVHDSKLMEVAT